MHFWPKPLEDTSAEYNARLANEQILPFMQLDALSQGPTTVCYVEPDESSPHPNTIFFTEVFIHMG
jgi:hypothetical protein